MYMFTLSRQEVKGYYAGKSTPFLHLFLVDALCFLSEGMDVRSSSSGLLYMREERCQNFNEMIP
jgi:hypothetical protein